MSPIIINEDDSYECKRKSCIHHIKPNNCIRGATWTNEKGKCSLYNNSFEDILNYIFNIFECEYPSINIATIKINLNMRVMEMEYTKKDGTTQVFITTPEVQKT